MHFFLLFCYLDFTAWVIALKAHQAISSWCSITFSSNILYYFTAYMRIHAKNAKLKISMHWLSRVECSFRLCTTHAILWVCFGIYFLASLSFGDDRSGSRSKKVSKSWMLNWMARKAASRGSTPLSQISTINEISLHSSSALNVVNCEWKKRVLEMKGHATHNFHDYIIEHHEIMMIWIIGEQKMSARCRYRRWSEQVKSMMALLVEWSWSV